ncbi:MAG TPA: universal stress protein [Usitatibacter sp.]|nr:universal stress protein [Usitatibacter sp.]
MYKHILVPTDGSKLSLAAARAAARLAAKLGARMTALHVVEPYRPPIYSEGSIAYQAYYSPEEYEARMREVAERATAKVQELARGVKCGRLTMMESQPWEAIVKAARSKKCDLIVMASHGRRGLAGLLLGSETQKVLTHSKVPVLVFR